MCTPEGEDDVDSRVFCMREMNSSLVISDFILCGRIFGFGSELIHFCASNDVEKSMLKGLCFLSGIGSSRSPKVPN